MLTKEVARGFYHANSYPVYEYVSKSGKRGQTSNLDGSRIIPLPRGYREVIRFHNRDEHFASYLKWLEEEHKGIPDEKLREYPNGRFIGRWRNARWSDEARRRNLS